jgi:hypothetical protein
MPIDFFECQLNARNLSTTGSRFIISFRESVDLGLVVIQNDGERINAEMRRAISFLNLSGLAFAVADLQNT